MKFFGAARGLLDEVTVLYRHPDLMAQREQQAELSRRESAAIGRA